MARESYYDLLRRPEWQRKRLEVMQAAERQAMQLLGIVPLVNAE